MAYQQSSSPIGSRTWICSPASGGKHYGIRNLASLSKNAVKWTVVHRPGKIGSKVPARMPKETLPWWKQREGTTLIWSRLSAERICRNSHSQTSSGNCPNCCLSNRFWWQLINWPQKQKPGPVQEKTKFYYPVKVPAGYAIKIKYWLCSRSDLIIRRSPLFEQETA